MATEPLRAVLIITVVEETLPLLGIIGTALITGSYVGLRAETRHRPPTMPRAAPARPSASSRTQWHGLP
ncbi:hypothetical protein [Arthrobacter pityocampae]|uniref:hypothetical protein n=1 Tax=Arthrobacter pityocampae TaxID=547334 RepID=UPI003735F133